MSVLEFPYTDGMDFGVGLNAITGEVKDNPFEDDSISVEPKKVFKSARDRSMISTESEYRQKIAAAAELHGKGLGWSASGSVSYMKDSVKGSSSLVFLDSVVVRKGGKDLANQGKWKLNADAEETLRTDPEEFLRQYGTHFVGGIIYGGSYVGSVTIETESSKAVEDLKAALSGAYKGVVTVGGSATFQQKLKETNKKYSIEASSYTEGGNTTEYELGDIDQMKKAADSFADNLKDEEPLVVICYPWDHLPCVKHILGHKTLLPEIKEEVRIHLSDDMLSLEYLGATVKHFLGQRLYAGESQRLLLKELDLGIRNMQQKIQNLTINELSQMDVDAAFKLVDSRDLAIKIEPIVRGECTIICECTIYPDWQLIEVKKRLPSSFEDNTYLFEITNVAPKDEFIEVARVHVPGKCMGYFFFKYNSVDPTGNPDVGGSRKLCAKVVAPGNWEQIGDWAKPDATSKTKDVGGGLVMTARFK